MPTILLAIADRSLREACRFTLHNAGHTPVVLERPLSALTLASKLRWDVACVDASSLGVEALSLLRGQAVSPAPVVGLGVEDPTLAGRVDLPLVAETFVACIAAVTPPAQVDEQPSVLRLDGPRRSAFANGLEVSLTRTEFRLLAYLLQNRSREIPLAELLANVWGFADAGKSASVLIRAHMRNLRLKLARVSLDDAVRSRRGHGYALVL
jgi:DNA-binding response OmpR family regulator